MYDSKAENQTVTKSLQALGEACSELRLVLFNFILFLLS